MAVYPSSPCPRIGASEFTKKYNVVKTNFEANYLQVRKATTRARMMFTLDYSDITKDEFNTLQTFFDNNIGTIFNYVHTEDGLTYQVTFGQDSINMKPKSLYTCDTQIILEGR